MLASSYKDETRISSVVLDEHYGVFMPINTDVSHVPYGRGCVKARSFKKKSIEALPSVLSPNIESQ
jgi:hypothetical protein